MSFNSVSMGMMMDKQTTSHSKDRDSEVAKAILEMSKSLIQGWHTPQTRTVRESDYSPAALL